MTTPLPEFAARFRDHLLKGDQLTAGDTVVVALSGGLDSVVLLHLLRFTPGLPDIRLAAAHVDHGMRERSRADAEWVAGLVHAWNVPLSTRTADRVPASEDEARSLRYTFYEEVRGRTDARWVMTAHHADDQVETVLFRIARGTGLPGLGGIPEFRSPGFWRPLLPFWREELEAYASAVGLGWRQDPTNAGTAYARNALRNRVIPLLEELVAPGTRDAVLRLARLAREDEEAWESLIPALISSLHVDHTDGRLSFDRTAFLEHHPAVRGRLLRTLARRVGGHLDASGTRIAVEFTSSGESGRVVHITGALDLRRELDRLVLAAGSAPPEPDRLVTVSGGEGEGEARLAGARYRVQWGPGDVWGVWTESFDAASLHGPLMLRAWAPGDRIRLSYGSKKLKKIFLEARLPGSRRDRTPVLVDARGQVLWVPGLIRSALARPSGSNHELNIGVTHAKTD